MCIRDRLLGAPDNYEVIFLGGGASMGFHMVPFNYLKPNGKAAYVNTCLLYTSDAADERSSVDLGGRRIIKKNNRRGTRTLRRIVY